MELLIYKASAGSGKTFTLAVEYIKRLVLNPFSYRNILAVTFTNKATTEMKERILEQLWGIWQGDPDSEPYMNAISERLSETDKSFSISDIRNRCGEALHRILHDYNRFQVTTIDSFFQVVTRNLARELGIGSNLNLEIKTEAVLDEAVDKMIAKLDEQAEELSWILRYIDSKIEDGKKWQVDSNLKSFGLYIFNERFIEKSKNLHDRLQVKGTILQYQKQLKAIKTNAINELKKVADQFESLMSQNGLEAEDISYGTEVRNYFVKLSNEKFDDKNAFGTRLKEKVNSASSWLNAKSKKKGLSEVFIKENFIPLLKEAEQCRQSTIQVVRSCDMATHYLYQLQLINAIREEVNNENHEKNRFLLADTNRLLNDLISENDSAFIFEKMGTYISHIMIDEFQDTSRMQWNNFKPLLEEGLAQGADSLIVGDVKQSIYRWRNGDWNILNNMQAQEHPHRIRIEPLDVNYRSEVNLIKFNNKLFQQMVATMNKQYKKELGEPCLPLLAAYHDVKQLSNKEKEIGYVKASFISKDNDLNYEEKTIEALGDTILQLINANIPLNQLAILLRSKTKLGDVATFLEKSLQIPVVSNEAFRLDASIAINIIVGAIRCLSDPEDMIAWTSLVMDYQLELENNGMINLHELQNTVPTNLLPVAFVERQLELQQMPLYELVEELFIIFSLHKLEKQDAYLFRFFDAVSEYLTENSSELTAFLQYWDEKLCTLTIPSGEIEGIRIMTIHASKGLEFNTVLIPFCDWSMTVDKIHEQIVWCSPQASPYNELDMVPVKFSDRMIQSVFKDDFLDERLQLWVDNLNILYVALTRAEKNMIIFSNQDSKQGTISELLYASIVQIAKEQELQISWNENEGLFEYGELVPYKDTSKKTTQNKLAETPAAVKVNMISNHPVMEFRESNRSADFIAGKDDASSSQRFMNRGSILHNLFAAIETINDIEPAIQNLMAEGVIGGFISEAEIRQEVTRAFSNPRILPWYDGSWQLFNEREIIWMTPEGLQQRRPDRVMLQGNEMIVVDFKFGKPKASHQRQVQTYLKILQQMGYINVKGYLWYVDENQIEEL